MKKIKDYLMLIKPSLSIMVVFSSVMSFALTKGSESYVDFWKMILLLFAGGRCVGNRQRQCDQPGGGERHRRPNETDSQTPRSSRAVECNGRMDLCHRNRCRRGFYPGKLFQLVDGCTGGDQFVPIRVHLHTVEKSDLNILSVDGCGSGSIAMLPERTHQHCY